MIGNQIHKLLDTHSTWDWEKQRITMPRYFVSVSGGRSSMRMAKIMQETFEGVAELIFLFANTGMEADETLDFVNECDKRWNLGIVWVEADVNPIHGQGTRSKVVTYETAARWSNWRNGSPFEDVIKKYGIPNVSRPHCTRELKLSPMYHYINSRWKKGSYSVAVGIRADETARRSKHAWREKILYPLLNFGITKADINKFWKDQDFDLNLPADAFGNCLGCWQKAFGKLALVNSVYPDVFEFMQTMEERYKHAGSGTDRKVFFRGYLSTPEMLEESKKYDLKSIANQEVAYPDESSGCSEGCEAFAEHQLMMFFQ